MGANAQTSVPTFTAGEILTAANMNISARTGIPVFADSTARDAAFGGTGEKTLAEGQFAYLENTNVTQYYDGAAWQPVGVAPALILISSTTIGTTVSSVAISNAFSSTYDNYRIIVSGGVGSASSSGYMYMGTGALPASGYYRFTFSGVYSGTTVSGFNTSNGAAWGGTFQTSTDSSNLLVDLFCPNLAKNTHIISYSARSNTGGSALFTGGYVADTTQYTGFTFAPDSGTLTGGTVKVYGYANS